jgi:cell division protein FtsL
MRLLHILVIGALVAAAAYVYEIKFESTLQAERLAKLRLEIRKERDAIATLRAEWAKLDNPARIQGLARRHLKLRPVDATQIDSFDKLPSRPVEASPQELDDPIGAIIEQDADIPTGSVNAEAEAR